MPAPCALKNVTASIHVHVGYCLATVSHTHVVLNYNELVWFCAPALSPALSLSVVLLHIYMVDTAQESVT